MDVTIGCVLIVGGDPVVQVSIKNILLDADFAVLSASDGPQAAKLIEQEAVDIVIIEAQLPGGIDGITVIRRARAGHPALKTLFLSEPTRQPVWDDPARDDFIVKPFRNKELLGCVFELLSRNPGQMAARELRAAAAKAGSPKAYRSSGCRARRPAR
jgi:DNA-binding response OmpR family regulator